MMRTRRGHAAAWLAVPLALLAALAAVPPADAYVYWTQGNGSGGPIGRANLDGSRVNRRLITGASSGMIAAGNAHIYWTGSPGGGVIGRANPDGTGVDRDFIALPGGRIHGIAVDAAHIYWLDGNAIGRANLDGTDVDRRFMVAVDAYSIASTPGTSTGATARRSGARTSTGVA